MFVADFFLNFNGLRTICHRGTGLALHGLEPEQIVSNESQEEFKMPPFPDETPELSFLPDLAERQATLRRANEALERARVLLERVRRLETNAPDVSEELK